jgi:capsular polysaccharide biosynthesis protein
MELKDYAQLLRPYFLLILGATVTFFVAGYLITLRKPPTFEASTTITVAKPLAAPPAESNYYQYDQYYSQLASAQFADTIANWLRSPGPVVEIYQKANLPPPSGSAAVVARTFRVSKGEDTTVISVTVKDKSEANALKIIETVKSEINNKIEELKSLNRDVGLFSVLTTPTSVFEVKTHPLISALLGGISGFVTFLVLSLLLATLSPRKRRQ